MAYYEMSKEKFVPKVRLWKEERDRIAGEIANGAREVLVLGEIRAVQVYLMEGNTKTGKRCYTVSLLPVIDCANCLHCGRECYDVRNDCTPHHDVVRLRIINSAIHKIMPSWYWAEVEAQVRELEVTELRINVGGDLNYSDFIRINGMAQRNPLCDFLFFTKNYSVIDEWLSENGDFHRNIKRIRSAWKGNSTENPHNLPQSHVLYKDGSTTADFLPMEIRMAIINGTLTAEQRAEAWEVYHTYICTGDCSDCHAQGCGCWFLPNGYHVIFMAH